MLGSQAELIITLLQKSGHVKVSDTRLISGIAWVIIKSVNALHRTPY